MNRIIIIGEGTTEQAFCHDILQPFFSQYRLYIENPTIKKSQGGIVSWESLKNQIEQHLKENQVVVTMLIDYYGIEAKHGFPKWGEAKGIVNKNDRMTFLEKAMQEEIEESVRYRFIPYIQLHEFEGLLFSDISVIEDYFEESEFNDHDYLVDTVERFDNPEEINDGKSTAPSKRLDRIFTSYSKTVYGPLLAGEIGLRTIREKCPRFNAWIEKLLGYKKED